jgi:hypothetical protein
MKFRVLLDISYIDLLVDAETEEDASNKVLDWVVDKNNRPFGARLRLSKVKVRKPWKYQLASNIRSTGETK